MEKEKVKLMVGKTEPCPCYTTPKEATWSETQWKKHWADRKKGESYVDILARLHKEARE